MIPSVKNKQTMEILKKLRQQGAPKSPEIGTVSLDMVTAPISEEGIEEPQMEESVPIPGTNMRKRKARGKAPIVPPE